MLPLEWKYPQAVLAERQRVAAQSDLRAKILFDLAGRPPYAWGLLTAAEAARFFGIKRITAIEFGVADGDGFLELSRLAEIVSQEVQVAIDVVGFDNGSGLPAPLDYRDHPEIWSSGDFAMANRESLYTRLPSGSRLILGDVKDTVKSFFEYAFARCSNRILFVRC